MSVRAANTQPTFNFLTGAEIGERPETSVLRERVVSAENEKAAVPENREVAELKAEVKTLRYTLNTKDQEQELAKLRQESEMREIRRRGDEDFQKMQVAEGERLKAVRRYDELLKELSAVRDAASNEKAALERRVREVEDGKRMAEEEVEDVKTERDDGIRNLERLSADLEARNKALQETVQELQQDNDHKQVELQETQQLLAEKDTQIGSLESEVLRLKAQTGDADTLGVIKRELSEQVAHIRSLEATNREQLGELKHFRRLHKSVEIVEEEKRALQRKVDTMEDLQQELGEARLQRQRLEDERLAWTAYLKSQAGEDGQLEFESPEELARALIHERLQNATLVERLGGLEPELLERDAIIKSLEEERAKLGGQMEKLRASGVNGGDQKARSRLERQKALAVKEVEYLRAQLTALDTEESTMELASFDEAKAQRIQQLEAMVEQYRTEVQSLHDELTAAQQAAPPAEASGTKRPREDAQEHEQLGQLSRKNRRLQAELSTLQTTTATLQTELGVAQERLRAAAQHSRTRILALRQNPTAEVEAVKMSTLQALRSENAALVAQLRAGDAPAAVVPAATLEAARCEVRDMERVVADKEKRMSRLKTVWGGKTMEFREGVKSLLGWSVEFMPNGKMKVTSLFHPSTDESENSIVFDGENGTMKVSGGPKSLFALKIRDQIKFWVTERGEIPCLLAALTMEFYDESTRAARH
ncbi:MAG: coiled-coil domain-containing protein mad1 [Claussenomyces sp. TS43310]|nr:MAG: coiled-coil domain-containing protein mad1 [Claussenomyces sp. TS43310]